MSEQRGEASVLMLVSASLDAEHRAEVAAGLRPSIESLRLEERYGVTLLDWTALGRSRGHRSAPQSLLHVARAVRSMRGVDVVFSDGEHLGIPLAVAMSVLRIKTPHLIIGHHLSTRGKFFLLRALRPYRRMDRILVHSPNQVAMLTKEIPALGAHLHVVPFGIDTDFWAPQPVAVEDSLVVSAGRDHRDYDSLMRARPEVAKLFIADHSPYSPGAERRDPGQWPENVERRALGRLELRAMYARASVVVVPVINTGFPFGITTLLEAMSMGKAIVASETDGLRGVVEHGRTGICVPPGDTAQLRLAIDDLLAHPEKREELGRQARRSAVERFGLEVYVGRLVGHLQELAGHDRLGQPG